MLRLLFVPARLIPAGLALALASASPLGASAPEPAPPRLAQVNPPSVPPPPVITPPRVAPDPLANRPERTQPGDEAPGAPSGAGPVEPDVVIADVSGAQPGLGPEIAQAHGLSLLAETRIALLGRVVLRLRIPDGRPVAEVVQALAGDARIEAAQPSHVYELQGAAGRPPQYTLEKLGLPAVHAVARGEGVLVALIDTGVDRAHETLRAARVRSLSVLDAGGPGPGDHGTRMAGLLVAHGALTGVAPAAELLAIEAFAPSGRGAGPARSHTLAVAKALDRAAREGAQVVNLSFAGGADPLISDILDALARRGIVLVAAAGNHGPGAPPAHPAAHPGVIAVTATDARDALFAQANRGDYVALAAPGVDVVAPGTGGRYGIISGTSAAAAHVSGVAALILERRPRLGPRELRALLARTATDRGAPGDDPHYGAGVIDPAAAVSSLSERMALPAE